MNSRQIVRQMDILRTLHARKYGVTIKELAEEYAVAARTIERDLDDLSEAGFSIYSDRKDGQVRWYLLQTRGIPPVNFPLIEVVALSFIEGILTPLEGTPFKGHYDAALKRIRAMLPEKMQAFLQDTAEVYISQVRGHKAYPESGEILEKLHQAVLDRKLCRVTYHAFYTDEIKTYPIKPFKVFCHRGGDLYLLCQASDYDDVITLAVERIQNLEVTDQSFVLPPDLAIEDRIRDAFGVILESPVDVRIRFSPQQAPYIRERIWHPSQEIQELEDGSIVLSLHVGGMYEIRSWILSFGSSAEVLQPAELREDVIAELQKSLDTYTKT